jgi:hypothetical protein
MVRLEWKTKGEKGFPATCYIFVHVRTTRLRFFSKLALNFASAVAHHYFTEVKVTISSKRRVSSCFFIIIIIHSLFTP